MPQSHLILYLEQKIMTSFYYLGIQKILKNIKNNFIFIIKKKTKTKPKPVSVRFFRIKTGFFSLARFFYGLVFSILDL